MIGSLRKPIFVEQKAKGKDVSEQWKRYGGAQKNDLGNDYMFRGTIMCL